MAIFYSSKGKKYSIEYPNYNFHGTFLLNHKRVCMERYFFLQFLHWLSAGTIRFLVVFGYIKAGNPVLDKLTEFT